MSRKIIVAAATAILLSLALAGCTAETGGLVLAFTSTDDDLSGDKDPQRIADAITAATGRPTEIFWVQSPQAAIEAMRSGQADAGFFDGAAAWFTATRFDFEAIAADVNSDGRDYYIASAWVNGNSPYDSMEALQGARSCHTGLLKSAGMFMPLGWLIKEGLVEVQGDPNDIGSIEPTVRSYFPDASIPSEGPYAGYEGALRCLSEGVGDVAFIKDSTVASYCGEDAEDWCSSNGYREIQQFGRVPSHAVMVSSDIDAGKQADLLAGLLSLNDSEAGQDILDEVLETEKLVAVTTESHLGEYGANLQYVPGINTYVEGKLN